MNKSVKNILYFITISMFLLSIKWYLEKKEYEPLISILGQISAFIVLFFENKIGSTISAKNNDKTDVDIDSSKGDSITIDKNKDSNIKVKTRD